MTHESTAQRAALAEAHDIEAKPPVRPVIITAPDRFVKLDLFEAMTGYTPKAVHGMIEKGKWLEGYEFIRIGGRGGNLVVDMEGYRRWVEHWRPTYTAKMPRPPYL